MVRVRDALGVTQDGAPFVRTGVTPPGDFFTVLQAIQDEGQWLPANCGGVPCNDGTAPTAVDVSADWSGLSSDKSTSVRRVSAMDTHMREDWAVGTSSFGLPNP